MIDKWLEKQTPRTRRIAVLAMLAGMIVGIVSLINGAIVFYSPNPSWGALLDSIVRTLFMMCLSFALYLICRKVGLLPDRSSN